MGKKTGKLPLQIAIDGPVAAGKGDIAARLAQELKLIYIYTGAMYRTLALSCIINNIPLKDQKKVVAHLKMIKIELVEADLNSKYPYKVLLNSKNVTDRIIEQDTAQGASDVGIIPEVRKIMVENQKIIAAGKNVVMEGRDIGLRVLPNAQLKIFLTASVEERAKRRFMQWQEKGISKTYAETLKDTQERDFQDYNRIADPLKKLPEAWELDTTAMTQDEVILAITKELHNRKLL
jgi:CMP/dCMP kinase